MGQSWDGYGCGEGTPGFQFVPCMASAVGVSRTLVRRGLQSAPGALPGLEGSQLCSCLGLAPALSLWPRQEKSRVSNRLLLSRFERLLGQLSGNGATADGVAGSSFSEK